MRAWIVLAVFLAAPPARADKGDTSLAAGLGYAMVAVDIREPSGGVIGADWRRGWNDAVSLRASGSYSLHYAAATAPAQGSLPSGAVHVAAATVGLTYAFDYLRVVPYGEIGIGGMFLHGDAAAIDSGLRGVVDVGVGADVLESRTFSWGVMIRLAMFLPDADSAPVYFQIGPRLTWRWNRF